MSFEYSTPTETRQEKNGKYTVTLSCGHTISRILRGNLRTAYKCPFCYPTTPTTTHVSSHDVSANSRVRFARAGRSVTRWQRRTGKSMY